MREPIKERADELADQHYSALHYALHDRHVKYKDCDECKRKEWR